MTNAAIPRPRQRISLFQKVSLSLWLILFFVLIMATGWVGRLGEGKMDTGLLALIWLFGVLLGWPIILVVLILFDQGMEQAKAERAYGRGSTDRHVLEMAEQLADLSGEARICFVAAAIQRHLDGFLAVWLDPKSEHGAKLRKHLAAVWAWLDGVPPGTELRAECERFANLQDSEMDVTDFFGWAPENVLEEKIQNFHLELHEVLLALHHPQRADDLHGYESCFGTIIEVLEAAAAAKAMGRKVPGMGYELIEHEMDRQRADLEQLSKTHDSQTITIIRDRARARSIFQSNWMTSSEYAAVAMAAAQSVATR